MDKRKNCQTDNHRKKINSSHREYHYDYDCKETTGYGAYDGKIYTLRKIE